MFVMGGTCCCSSGSLAGKTLADVQRQAADRLLPEHAAAHRRAAAAARQPLVRQMLSEVVDDIIMVDNTPRGWRMATASGSQVVVAEQQVFDEIDAAATIASSDFQHTTMSSGTSVPDAANVLRDSQIILCESSDVRTDHDSASADADLLFGQQLMPPTNTGVRAGRISVTDAEDLPRISNVPDSDATDVAVGLPMPPPSPIDALPSNTSAMLVTELCITRNPTIPAKTITSCNASTMDVIHEDDVVRRRAVSAQIVERSGTNIQEFTQEQTDNLPDAQPQSKRATVAIEVEIQEKDAAMLEEFDGIPERRRLFKRSNAVGPQRRHPDGSTLGDSSLRSAADRAARRRNVLDIDS